MFCTQCYKNWNERINVTLSYINDDGVALYHCPVCYSTMSNPLQEDSMGEKTPEEPKSTVWESKAVVCQCCKFHSNKPSTCDIFHGPVGRKKDARKCHQFKRKN